jgi:prophage regulatory protein
MDGKVLRIDQVSDLTGFAPSTIRSKVRTGEFPTPIRLGRRALAWPETQVVRWLRSRPLQGADSR